MGWKQRGRKRYYYRSEGGRKLYLGRGEAAQYAASHAAASRTQREQALAEETNTRQSFAAADVSVRSFVDAAGTLIEAAFLAAGYYRHARGAWRRRRTSHAGDDAT